LVLPFYLKFLADPEPEMKSIASLKIEDLVEVLDVEDISNKLIPQLKQI
jgi:hypothetical protein